MASFNECIDIALKNKRISKDVAQAVLSSQDPNAAIDDILGNLSRQRRETAIQAVRFAQAFEDIKSHPDGMYYGLTALMAKDPRGKAKFSNVESRKAFYEGRYHSEVAELLSRFKTKMFGLTQDEKGLNKLIRAIYGEAVDDPEIEKFAKQWLDVTEKIRSDFNANGGSVSKNERWFMPQKHDARAIQKLGRETWKEEIKPLLDRQYMLDDAGKPLNDADYEEMLDYVYETITTGGLNKVKEMTVPRMGKKLSRKGSERRVLYFKDAKSWIDYQNKYGKGDIFTTLTDHINAYANDVA